MSRTSGIRLVCIDVDGTLVGSSGDVHPAVWRAAARAREAGIRLAVCSGRPGFGVTRSLAERLDPGGWHCFQNGASVIHLASGRSRSARLPDETARMLVTRAREERLILELYADMEYAVERDVPLAREHARLLGVPFVPRPFEALPGPIVRGQWLLTREDADRVLDSPHPGLEVSPSTSPLVPDALFVNLTPLGVDKATAVMTLAEEYGVSAAEVMFVGDGWNDAVAMRLVGFPVAMGNAEPEAIELARVTVGHVDEGGLAEALALAIAGG